MVEALREKHQSCRIDVLGRPKEPRFALGSELEVEQRHVRGNRRDRKRRKDGVSERGWNLALPDPVPLDLPIKRPVGLGKRPLPDPAELWPVGVAYRDPPERKEPALI